VGEGKKETAGDKWPLTRCDSADLGLPAGNSLSRFVRHSIPKFNPFLLKWLANYARSLTRSASSTVDARDEKWQDLP